MRSESSVCTLVPGDRWPDGKMQSLMSAGDDLDVAFDHMTQQLKDLADNCETQQVRESVITLDDRNSFAVSEAVIWNSLRANSHRAALSVVVLFKSNTYFVNSGSSYEDSVI